VQHVDEICHKLPDLFNCVLHTFKLVSACFLEPVNVTELGIPCGSQALQQQDEVISSTDDKIVYTGPKILGQIPQQITAFSTVGISVAALVFSSFWSVFRSKE